MTAEVRRVRTLLVEDEPEARQNLRDYAALVDWLEIVGEARDGGKAVRLIDALLPDLVLLDVQLPVHAVSALA